MVRAEFRRVVPIIAIRRGWPYSLVARIKQLRIVRESPVEIGVRVDHFEGVLEERSVPDLRGLYLRSNFVSRV